MNNNILEFCNKYETKLKNDKDISTNELDLFVDNRERITFKVCTYIHVPKYFMSGNNGIPIIDLDTEDLKYLYEKYSKKLKEEMELNIENIKNLYKQ